MEDLIKQFQHLKQVQDSLKISIPKKITESNKYRSIYFFCALTESDNRQSETRKLESYFRMFHALLWTASTENAFTAFADVINDNTDHFGNIIYYLQEG